MGDKQKWGLWAAIGWIVLLVFWVGWDYYHFSGLYRRLAEWQVAQWGQYQKIWTAIIPAAILSIPSMRILRRHEKAAQAALAAGADRATAMQRVRNGVLALGIATALIAVGVFVTSQQLPDPSDPPVEINLATLGDAAPPTGSVILAGAMADTDRALQIEEQFRSRSADIDHQTIYVPIVAEGAVQATPVRFFIDRASYGFAGSGDAPRTNVFLASTMRGVLVENGLPAEVIAAFAKQGVTMASPHYLLTTNAVGGRTNYHVVAALSGLFAFVLLVLAAAQSVAIGRLRRSAG